MTGATPSSVFADEELTGFGLSFADDSFHPYDPADRSWNESWFWDWYNDDGTVAGHCRIGCMANENRVWLWLYLFRDGEWIAVEQPFLDFGLMRRPEIAFDQPGISFSYRIDDPLRAGRLRVSARGRIVSGTRAGRTVPVSVDLAVSAVGPPHTTGAGDQEGHSSEHYDARRFEQPIDLAGTMAIDRDERPFIGRGERDHSWGPRYWQIEWSFLVLNGPNLRLQCVEVRFPGDGTIEVGYVRTDTTQDLVKVDLQVVRDLDLAVGASGRLSVVAADDTTLAFTFAAISTHEMDLSHVLIPHPPQSTYRRSLIRATPTDGGPPLIGWLEDHVMPEGVAGMVGDQKTGSN